MYVDKKMALKIETCIKQTHIEVTKLYTKGKILEINGGAACFSGFNSFLSQVVGWGFSTQTSNFKKEIAVIEGFYKNLDHTRVDIELCPYVGNTLVTHLSQNGYKISELNNVSLLDLTLFQKKIVDLDGFIIKPVPLIDLDTWAKRVALGFGYPKAQDQFLYYAQAKGVTAFAAYDPGSIIAGAAIAEYGDVCDLGVTSTLPLYRGKGLQKELILARLHYAKSQNRLFATVTTEPGTISDLNVQKIGFRCAYTRIKLTKDL
jgi:GNAT superfamily N-acetyltransferase